MRGSTIRQANGIVKKKSEGGSMYIFKEDVDDKDFYTAEMEVFKAGIHNGDKYKNKDLDSMVEAFNTLKNRWKPTLKIGHGKQLAEQPALGYVERLRRVGDALIAKVVNIPKIVKNVIEKGLYKKRSAEIYWDYKEGNKAWPKVLKAIALLGESIPAVSSLKDVEKFFDGGDGELKVYESDIEDSVEEQGQEAKEYIHWSEKPDRIEARVRPIDLFDFTTFKEVKFRERAGVHMNMGSLLEAPEELAVQCWLFDRRKWTMEKAQVWLEGAILGPERDYTVTKLEKGIEFPKEAFLYVPTQYKPATWKFRIWEDLDRKVTDSQLEKTAAKVASLEETKALSIDGIKQVKERLKVLFKKAKIEVPKYLHEDREEKKMDFEKKLKEAEEEIKKLTKEIAELQTQEKTKEVMELQEQISKQSVKIKEMQVFKEEADKLKKARDEALKKVSFIEEERRNDTILNFVKDHGVNGTKRILPRDEKLVIDILSACPQEKKYKFDNKDASLEDLVKTFIQTLPARVDISQRSSADESRTFANAIEELEAGVVEYRRKDKKAGYAEAFDAVLAADADLKERYHKERI